MTEDTIRKLVRESVEKTLKSLDSPPEDFTQFCRRLQAEMKSRLTVSDRVHQAWQDVEAEMFYSRPDSKHKLWRQLREVYVRPLAVLLDQNNH